MAGQRHRWAARSSPPSPTYDATPRHVSGRRSVTNSCTSCAHKVRRWTRRKPAPTRAAASTSTSRALAPPMRCGVPGNPRATAEMGRRVSELPSGTVTFLFTDLVVSTRLWDTEPDAMRTALARHDELLRAAVEAHDGVVVKGRGDGVHAVFATADAALLVAVDAQRAMADEAWGVSEPLRIRVGIHTGVADERDGDYFGSAVNRAARLEAVAHGGQVVCSQATADLAIDALPEGVALVDLGEHRLRDLMRAERVFQV